MTIEERCARVEEQIQRACDAAGRGRNEVTLIAVTKTRTPEEINRALKTGISDIGENRVQELLAKLPELSPARVHLIGQLQTNKVKAVLGKAQVIHSLDRLHLAKELDRAASLQGLTPVQVLIEVNIAREETKSGIFFENVSDFLDILADFRYIKPIGLMTVAPMDATEAEQDRYFEKMQSLLPRGQALFGPSFCELSMGMSRDFPAAIRHGATMVRVGTALFGERQYLHP
ncbi:MAG: YggS family pyridoxal phosphate-dependent enzyme [Clostridia bacterium]|nr:YggS family pyridoxal phosphate-dependent enzyme [Clostridia bacterium]